MPQAVTHVLVAIVLAQLIRDYFVKDKQKFPLHYVLIAGIAGLLPDIDIIAYWALHFFGFTLAEVHRTFTHTIFVPLLFLGLFFIFDGFKLNISEFGKRHMKLAMVFLMIAFGSAIHLFLDAIICGQITFFYPLSSFSFGLDLVSKLPNPLSRLAVPCLDAAILVLWLIYLEIRHKISSFL